MSRTSQIGGVILIDADLFECSLPNIKWTIHSINALQFFVEACSIATHRPRTVKSLDAYWVLGQEAFVHPWPDA